MASLTRTTAVLHLAALGLLGVGLGGCVAAGAAADVAGTAVGTTVKVAGAVVGVGADAVGAAGRAASGGPRQNK